MAVPPALPAATILVVRDGPTGLEVLMVHRHGKSSFVPDALVFPGGKVDDGDAALAPPGDPSDLLPYRVAAIRETWEEAGIFLARRKGSDRLIEHAEVPNPRETPDLAPILARDRIELATDRLAHYAHWITPDAEPRRFDTQFFIAEAPPDQLAIADGYETLDCRWTAPGAAIREADARRVRIVFPTYLNLVKLARSKTAQEALGRARQEHVVTVQPDMFSDGGERVIRIPPNSGYELTEMRFKRGAD